MPPAIEAVGSILMMIVMCVMVIIVAYYGTRMLGRHYGGGQGKNLGSMQVLDRLVLGQDRMLVIVRVADQTMLLGVTPHHIEKICDIAADQLPEPSKPEQAEPFAGLLQRLMQKGKLGVQSEKDDKHDGS